jgi:hypothetical protein
MERHQLRDEDITPGVIVIYTLRSNQLPRHPEKEWRGEVLRYDRFSHRVGVESLEAGYEACEDDVWFEQIVRIEKPTGTSSTLMC